MARPRLGGLALLAALGGCAAAPASEGAPADARAHDATASERADLDVPDTGGPTDARDGAALPRCRLELTRGTANITAPTTPIAGSCPGERTDDGMGHRLIDFQPGDQQDGVARTFSIEQFAIDAPEGAVFALDQGFDPIAGRGISVRYIEITATQTNVWRADRGTVTVASTRSERYTLELAAVHMVPAPDPTGTNRAAGELEVNGTIVSVLP